MIIRKENNKKLTQENQSNDIITPNIKYLQTSIDNLKGFNLDGGDASSVYKVSEDINGGDASS